MKVGFTGTARGVTKAQGFMLAKILYKLSQKGMTEFHHGDCIGADERAHSLVETLPGIKIIIHPPLDDGKRAFCKGHEAREPDEYLTRDGNIVNETQMLVATPGEKEEVLRSGTWATVRRAQKAKKPIWFVFPDGGDRIEEGK